MEEVVVAGGCTGDPTAVVEIFNLKLESWRTGRAEIAIKLIKETATMYKLTSSVIETRLRLRMISTESAVLSIAKAMKVTLIRIRSSRTPTF